MITQDCRDCRLLQATLTLQEDGAPFSADRSAIIVVSFPTDRHHHSGEQVANVLTARKFLCYHNGENKVSSGKLRKDQ